jgi:hypothetical protein
VSTVKCPTIFFAYKCPINKYINLVIPNDSHLLELLSHHRFLKYVLSPPEFSTECPLPSFQSPLFTLFRFSIGSVDDSRIFIAKNFKHFTKNLRFRHILLSFAYPTNIAALTSNSFSFFLFWYHNCQTTCFFFCHC